MIVEIFRVSSWPVVYKGKSKRDGAGRTSLKWCCLLQDRGGLVCLGCFSSKRLFFFFPEESLLEHETHLVEPWACVDHQKKMRALTLWIRQCFGEREFGARPNCDGKCVVVLFHCAERFCI